MQPPLRRVVRRYTQREGRGSRTEKCKQFCDGLIRREIYWRALQIGEPTLLADAEMDVIIEKFRHYGQPPR
jgi:hypothetical protein